MKLPHQFQMATVVAALALTACGSREQVAPPSNPAVESHSSPAASSSSASPFERVMSRLDVGGKMLEVHDHDGRREVVLGIAEMMMGTLLVEMPRENLELPALLDAFGVGRAAASGRSIRKDGEAWLLRSYTYQPKGRKGLDTLLGQSSAPFLSPGMLPAAVDLVVEARLDITAFPVLFSEIARAVGQEEAADGFLKQEMPAGGALLDLLGQSKLHLIAGIDVSSWDPAGGNQRIDFFFRLDGGKMILQSLQPQITQALGEPEMVGKLRQWPFPLEALGQEPGLLLADEEGTLTFASSRAYLESAQGTQGKLAGDSAFMAATDHFPKSGNLLVYASPQTPPFVASLIKQFALPQIEKEMAPLLAKATDSLSPHPWSFCLAHEADGSMILAELPFPGEADIGAALPMLSATSVAFIGARAWKDGSDRAGCVLNIRNVQTAVRSYQSMQQLGNGDEIPWDKIIGPGAFLEQKPVCPAGGTYTFAKTVPGIGGLACRCSHAEHAPPNHENW